MKSCRILPLLALLGLSGTASAIKIEIRYDYDTQGFFNNPAAKAALEAVADYYGSMLHDSLPAINNTAWPAGNTWTARTKNPATGANLEIPNLVVPEDTLVVFAGARALGGAAGLGGPGGYGIAANEQAWVDTIVTRGQPGAAATPKTDFGPWGGMITFDPGISWNFSLTDPTAGGLPFVSIALHELGHLLGIGTAGSWTSRISGSNFTGPRSVAVYGGNVPLDPATSYGHWRNNSCAAGGYDPEDENNVLSKAAASFGTPHGIPQIGLLDPQICTNGDFHKVITDLDLAALQDIGWEVLPPLELDVPALDPAAAPLVFSWPSTSGLTYQLQSSTTLGDASWTPLSTQAGNGDVQQHSIASPPPAPAFFRLATVGAAAAATMRTAAAGPVPLTAEPVEVSGCQCGVPWEHR